MDTRALAISLLISLVVACGPAQSGQGPTGVESSPTHAPKVLNITSGEGLVTDFPGAVGRNVAGISHIVHNYLVVRNEHDEFIPQLAIEQLSVEKGTWRVNPDGTMDTTWKIHPNVKWHDGTPFTSADLMFTLTAFMDAELPSRYGSAIREINSATAPDPYTFVVHWKKIFGTANEAPALHPLPKHLLEDAYLNDKGNFGQNPLLSHKFIGLGPYRIATWNIGSHIEAERFDQYFRGRPPLDRVVLRFISDPNTIMANLLAGTVDIAWGNDVDIAAAVELKRRWEGTGNQVLFTPLGDLQQVEFQFRPEYARPRLAATERPVRQALWHAIDRQALVDTAAEGLSPVADTWFSPLNRLRTDVGDNAPRYPYDVRKAQELMSQAGWIRGADGILVHNQTGERFDYHVSIQEEKSEQDQLIVADYWKAIGVNAIQGALPRPRDREAEAKQSGIIVTSPKGYEVPYLDSSRLHTANISTAANRWTGRNRGGYVNPEVDALINRISVTIDPKEALPLHRQLLQVGLGDVALIPLYFDVDAIAMLRGVKGPRGGTTVESNFFEWTKD